MSHARFVAGVVVLAMEKFKRDDMATHAAALAFYILFSIFPFALFLVALLSFFELSVLLEYIEWAASKALSAPAMERARAAFSELRVPRHDLLSFGVLLSVWLASRGTRSAMKALNVAYGTVAAEPRWQRWLASIFYTIGIAAILISGVGLLTIGPEAMQWMAHFAGLEQIVVRLWTLLRWPAGLFLLIAGVAALYYIDPNARKSWHLVSPGAAISVIGPDRK